MGFHGCELNVDFLISGNTVFLTVNCVCFELTENLKSRVAKGGMIRAKLQKTLGLGHETNLFTYLPLSTQQPSLNQ